MTKIAASMLSADFARLGEEVADVCACGADYLHVDIMDGVFVPNISFGADVMRSVVPMARVAFDVHLMIEDPDRYLEAFAGAYTAYLTVHSEACRDLAVTLAHIHSTGVRAGIAISPDTAVAEIAEFLPLADLVLVMSVYPGFGGQRFLDRTLPKVGELAALRAAHGYRYVIEIDGGIRADNAAAVRAAGTDILVAGSAVFGAADRREAIAALRGVREQHETA